MGWDVPPPKTCSPDSRWVLEVDGGSLAEGDEAHSIITTRSNTILDGIKLVSIDLSIKASSHDNSIPFRYSSCETCFSKCAFMCLCFCVLYILSTCKGQLSGITGHAEQASRSTSWRTSLKTASIREMAPVTPLSRLIFRHANSRSANDFDSFPLTPRFVCSHEDFDFDLYSVKENSYDCPRSWRNMSNIATAPVLNPSCLQSNSWARYQTAGVRGTLELQPNSDFLKGHLNSYQSAVKSSTSINQTCHEIIRKSSAVGIADQILFYPDPFQDDLGNLRSYWPTNWTEWNSRHFRHKIGALPQIWMDTNRRSWWFQKLPKPMGQVILAHWSTARVSHIDPEMSTTTMKCVSTGTRFPGRSWQKAVWRKHGENRKIMGKCANWSWMWAKKTPPPHWFILNQNISIYQSISLSIYQSINQSIYLSIYLLTY